MEYFILEQDRRLGSLDGLITCSEQMKKGYDFAEDEEFVYIDSPKALEYGCILEKPVLLVSEDVYQILNRYGHGLAHKKVIVIDMARNGQVHYYLPNFTEVPCTDQEYVKKNAEDIEKLDLFMVDEKLIEGISMFKLNVYRKSYLVVRLDVAEGMLRTSLYGLNVRRILINGR